MIFQDWRGVIILTILYIHQGLSIGFPFGGLQIILAANGIPYEQIGLISFAGMPFAFKCIWSPFLDFYYFETIGKRKTYILPGLILIGIAYIFLMFKFDNWVSSNQFWSILICTSVVIIFLASIDIAIDGWSITLLTEENIGLGSVCQTFGQSIGAFLSSYILILLNSTKFCNQFIYKTPQNEPVILISTYYYFMAFLSFALFLILIFVSEINPKQVFQFDSIKDQIKIATGIFKNQNLRQLSYILFFSKLGFCILEDVAPLFLVKSGLSKEIFSRIGMLNALLVMPLPLFIGKFITGKKQEAYTSNLSIKVYIFNMIFFMSCAIYFQQNPTFLAIILIGINLLLTETMRRINILVNFSFVAQISEGQIGGMSISILGSISNLSRVFFSPLLMTMLSYVSFYVLLILSIVQEVWFLYMFETKFLKLQKLPKSSWNFQSKQNDLEFQLIMIKNNV